MNWLASTAAKVAIALGVVALIAAVLWLQSCSRERTVATQAKVNTGLANAAIESGGDAVDTVGNRAATDSASDATTRANDAAIRAAEGASVAVSNAADVAGRKALCKRAAYRETAQCASYR